MNKIQYLLDTDILISMLNDKFFIREFLVEIGFDSCAVCNTSLSELYFGAYKGKNTEKSLRQIRFIENNFVTIQESPTEYGKLRAELEKNGTPLNDMDLLIASAAISNDLTLVTHNTKHFSRIPNLKIEDWVGNPELITDWIKERY